MRDVQKHAVISDCGTFRYLLTRQWADGPSITFVMLNPSTADADKDDATVRKCIGFARNFKFSGIRVVNLFAFRATNPADLRRAGWPAGPENNQWLDRAATWAWANNEPMVCAWGAHTRGRTAAQRVAHVTVQLEQRGVDLRALQVLVDGTPSHPLMLPYSCQLMQFARQA
jgi:hypothetical protein